MAYNKILTTARLTLRKPETADAGQLQVLHGDPEVMRYFSEPPWTDPSRPLAQIEKDRAAFEREESFRFSIVLNSTGSLIGNCSLFALHRQNRRAEIGYALQRAHWGKGYMHEALEALLHHAFIDHDLNRIEADIDPRNEGSTSCLEGLGFRREGLSPERWIVAGEKFDSALYGLLRRDWESRLPI